MKTNHKSLAELIDELSRENDVSETFLVEVGTLFSSKGISLDAACAPYEPILRETFLREAQLRVFSRRAHEGLERLQDRMGRLNELWQQQLHQLQRTRDLLETRSEELRHHAERLRAQRRGSRRPSLDDDAPRCFVPGPKDVQ